MIKDNQKYFNRLHILIDAAVIAASYWFAWFLKFETGIFESVRSLSFQYYMTALLLIVPMYLILYSAFNLYTPKRVQGRRLELANIVKANTLGLFILIGILYLLKIIDFSRSMLLIFLFVNIDV